MIFLTCDGRWLPSRMKSNKGRILLIVVSLCGEQSTLGKAEEPRSQAEASTPSVLDSTRIEAMKAVMKEWYAYPDIYDVFHPPATSIEIPDEELFAEPLSMLRDCMRIILQPSLFPPGMNADNVPVVGIQDPKGRQMLRAAWTVRGQTIVIRGSYNQLSLGIIIDGGQSFAANPFGGGDTEGFLEGVARLVAWPDIPASQFEFRGGATDVAGVKVHKGRIERKQAERPGEWYESAYVFFTDSVPQYAYFAFGRCVQLPLEKEPAQIPVLLFQPPPKPLTEADLDPDVAKRPGFWHALATARLGGHRSFFGFDQGVAGQELPPDEIFETPKETLRRRWQVVVAPGFLPSREAGIAWKGRNEYPTAPEQNTLAARWDTPAGQLSAVGCESSLSLRLCLRLSGDDRISFRFRRGDELGWPQDVLDKARLLEMLTTYLRFPFESVDDFKVLIGQSGVYAEVRVFSGSIQWPRQPLEGRPDALLGWEIKSDPDNKARLFITDSEPQYFCISVDTDGPD